ncbi:MAG: hypothetical protein AMXMBFR13_44690 [Phycisphaerae bacterium]
MTATLTRSGPRAVPVEPGQIELILAQIESLPTLPAIASRLLELTTSDTSSAREVIQAVESDQSLAARLLSLVRKAHTGSNVVAVDRAVVLLGFEAVRSLVLSVQVFETFSHRQQRSGGQFDRAEFWKHSLAVGCAARLLAEAVLHNGVAGSGAAKPEEAFICGLLHDLGKVALDACFPKSYDRVMARVEDVALPILDAEREVFGLDHSLAGSRLAMHWKLPAMIAESIWLHHSPLSATPTRVAHPEHVRLVQVADRLVRHMRIGYSGNWSLDEPLDALAESLGLSGGEFERVLSALPELIEARATFIGLDRLTSKEVYEGALARANAELARINGSLAEANRRLQKRSRCFEALVALRAGLGDTLTHERVVGAAVEALEGASPGQRFGVLGYSRGRSILVIAAGATGSGESVLEVVDSSVVGPLGSLTEMFNGWVPASILPRPLADRVATAMGDPPAWCRPIWGPLGSGFAGAFFAGGDKPDDGDDLFVVLSDWLGAWLAAAESAASARQLNEDQVDINRRLHTTQAELAHMRSLSMVGEMAAGAAHELNNPLAVISGRAQLLNREEYGDEVRRTAALISEHAHRASGMVSELMEFAKPAAPRPETWELRLFLEELRRDWIEKGVLSERQFRLELSDRMPAIRADAAQIRVLFDELIRNSIEACKAIAEPLLVVNCRTDVADDRVVIRVKDNGCGMTPEVLERAITPFFSHRTAGRGRGLGLSRASRYAEINGGRLRLSSRPGDGTQVTVELPAAR